MGILICFRDGFIFASGEYFLHQGAYTAIAQRPNACNKCQDESGAFYAHGRFKRGLFTFKNHTITKIKIWKNRWLCLCCNRTMSNGPPDILPHMPYCTSVIVVILWSYLNGNKGIHDSIPPQLDYAPSPRTLARYLKRAKVVCKETYQAIKEVLLEMRRPRPWDKAFAQGLSPPERLNKWHRKPEASTNLWRALAMLLTNSDAFLDTPCFLMARAITKIQNKNSSFLL